MSITVNLRYTGTDGNARKFVEEMLPSDKFLRVHRSFIIAVDKIKKVDRNDCIYIGEEIIHVPDGYLPTFRAFVEKRRFCLL